LFVKGQVLLEDVLFNFFCEMTAGEKAETSHLEPDYHRNDLNKPEIKWKFRQKNSHVPGNT
jgi:hypothetical protein